MENTKITISRDISTGLNPCVVTEGYELWWDSNINDWVDLFKSILFRQGFDIETINEVFKEE